MQELLPEEYEKWAAQHEDAEMSLDDDREQMIFESALRIEKEMELLGVTGKSSCALSFWLRKTKPMTSTHALSGIEDRLQDGVADCIAALREAGIKVWVLTGTSVLDERCG